MLAQPALGTIMAALPTAAIPPVANELFWELFKAIAAAAYPGNAHALVTNVDLSSEEVMALLSATVEEDNAPFTSLVDAITRAVNDEGDGD